MTWRLNEILLPSGGLSPTRTEGIFHGRISTHKSPSGKPVPRCKRTAGPTFDLVCGRIRENLGVRKSSNPMPICRRTADEGLLDMAYNKAMRTEPADLLRDALSLPAEARAALIDSLLESLDVDADHVEVDGNSQEAWRDEIQRRLQQIDTETVSMIPWDDPRHALRSGLQR